MILWQAATVMTLSALRLLFDNDRVRVSDLRLGKGESIQRTLAYPTVRWQVEDGIELISEAAGTTTKSSDGSRAPPTETRTPRGVEDKTVIFEDANTTCDIVNGGESIFRQIWFEMKTDPRRTEEETRRILDNAIYTTDVGTTLLFENRYCRVWDFFLEPGGGDASKPHHHVLDYVFVYVAKGRLLGYTHDGKPGLFDSTNEDGDVTWFDLPDGAEKMVDCAHGGKNGYYDIPMREYLVELK